MAVRREHTSDMGKNSKFRRALETWSYFVKGNRQILHSMHSLYFPRCTVITSPKTGRQ
jgi:hypothetical protein